MTRGAQLPHEDAERGDAELITAARAGDEDAFGVLWSRHELAARRWPARSLSRATSRTS
jgi:hypothetical protein